MILSVIGFLFVHAALVPVPVPGGFIHTIIAGSACLFRGLWKYQVAVVEFGGRYTK